MRAPVLSWPALMLLALPATSAAAQMHDMGGMSMPGMAMPAKPARRPVPKPVPTKPAPAHRHAHMMPAMPATSPAETGAAPCPPEHAAMGHCSPPAPPTPSPPSAATLGTDQPAGDAPPPAPPTTSAAAAFYDPATMARADRTMRAEHGGMRFSRILLNLAEVQPGRDGYRWDGEGWFGGDIDRLVIRTEGEGRFGRRVDAAEVQALYSRAVDPYWNLQAGLRQDVGSGARRTYASVGVEGLAPYWFDVEGRLFLSDRGDLLARAEAWYDQRLTQRAILQPRVELNLAAQDVPTSRIGAGLSSAEVGLRLRYEIRREFAPYVGVSWERRYGATARYARAGRNADGGLAVAIGVRAWY